jgi:hypothetical protein
MSRRWPAGSICQDGQERSRIRSTASSADIHIEAVCISVLGNTQPARIVEYVRSANRGGAGGDGLMQRFGLLAWPDAPGEWRDIDQYPNSAAREKAYQAFERMAKLDTAAALRLGAEKGPYDKALINHLADEGAGPVSHRALLKALAAAYYLESHARRVYGSASESELAVAKAILKHIRNGDLNDGFTARDVHQKGWAHLTEREDVAAGLRLLVDLDYLAPSALSVGVEGGRPKVTYLVNPRGLT